MPRQYETSGFIPKPVCREQMLVVISCQSKWSGFACIAGHRHLSCPHGETSCQRATTLMDMPGYPPTRPPTPPE
ncbi:hypothetical protein L227DRAFT_85771 [Lentinus tigrinus ALCF2SS1-6]|uniref:Copper-fist domain-containing protein n=1 Tax=Lentinus tigrinus ALCF2SS1-6 TaxID=1328759 RepID=A0A5C2SAU0_9APHY|nr:hypothetical protein L227DRAFT_85771 [Lentinus tigrinus ALCF2SS1-6]